jgi:hypothetical protein
VDRVYRMRGGEVAWIVCCARQRRSGVNNCTRSLCNCGWCSFTQGGTRPELSSPRFRTLRADLPLGLHCIAGDHPARQLEGFKHLRSHAHFVGVPIHGHLGEHHTTLRKLRRQQLQPVALTHGDRARVPAGWRLPIDYQHDTAALRPCGGRLRLLKNWPPMSSSTRLHVHSQVGAPT